MALRFRTCALQFLQCVCGDEKKDVLLTHRTKGTTCTTSPSFTSLLVHILVARFKCLLIIYFYYSSARDVIYRRAEIEELCCSYSSTSCQHH
jgi:hypothetical protein